MTMPEDNANIRRQNEREIRDYERNNVNGIDREDNDYVERVRPDELGSEEESKSGLQSGGMKQLLTVVVIALVISIGTYMFMVKPNLDSFATDITNIVSDLGNKATTQQVKDLSSIIGGLQSSQQDINTALSQKAESSQVTSLNDKISSFQNQLNNIPTKSDLQQEVASAIQSQTAGINTSLESISVNINDMNTTLNTYVTRVEELEGVVGDIINEEEEESNVPTISYFTPTYGVSGTVVTIYGENFFDVTNVTFGGVSAYNVVVQSENQIQATVSSNGATGIVNVYTMHGMANSVATFTYGTSDGGGSSEEPSGNVVASIYNGTMYWSQGLPVGESERSFGLKIQNGTDKNLVHVNMTITLQSYFPISYFEFDPELYSSSGLIVWQYTPGAGNSMTFHGEGYIYVPSGSEFAEMQTLKISCNNTYTGTRVISATKVTINSKTLQ